MANLGLQSESLSVFLTFTQRPVTSQVDIITQKLERPHSIWPLDLQKSRKITKENVELGKK